MSLNPGIRSLYTYSFLLPQQKKPSNVPSLTLHGNQVHIPYSRVANRGNRHLAGTWTQELSLLYQMNSDALDSLKADGVVWEPQGGKGRFTERALVGKLGGGFSKHKCEFKILLEVGCFFWGVGRVQFRGG